MIPIAYFGINSSTVTLVIDLLILFLAIVYLSLIYWTFSDARRRIADPLLVGCATVAALFPFVGPIVYTILRPPEFLEDARERELEVRAAEVRVAQMQAGLCPHCDYPVERDFVRCPSCRNQIKERCTNCSKPLDPAWTICPYCETEVAGAVPAPVRSRRRRARAEQQAQTKRSERSARRDLSDPAMDGPDLLGSTIEADELVLSDGDGVAPVPTSTREGSRAERRSRRTRPQRS